MVFWKIDDFTNTFWLHLTFKKMVHLPVFPVSVPLASLTFTITAMWWLIESNGARWLKTTKVRWLQQKQRKILNDVEKRRFTQWSGGGKETTLLQFIFRYEFLSFKSYHGSNWNIYYIQVHSHQGLFRDCTKVQFLSTSIS